MTCRIESRLHAEFSEAASLEDRPAAQVLRELMRKYVHQSRARACRPANDPISPAERRNREAAVNFARTSVQLEGLEPSDDAEERARQYIEGEIQVGDFVQPSRDEK